MKFFIIIICIFLTHQPIVSGTDLDISAFEAKIIKKTISDENTRRGSIFQRKITVVLDGILETNQDNKDQQYAACNLPKELPKKASPQKAEILPKEHTQETFAPI